ncbi:hypothetical protein QR680_008086 [Steinernema hermaphroditum]|uniref:Mediator complex subunit 11 n=1 Tax=Steinernema hermaphroditum TaxID=289476 RepID=A0AA39M784_9BILA|nr:hypothetical protein QR680_008086 [Steinernema hermaphroditum]
MHPDGDDIDRRLNEILKCAREVIGEMTGDKKMSVHKAAESLKTFKRNLKYVESHLLSQLNRMEQVQCQWNHEHSSFIGDERVRQVDGINAELAGHLSRIHDKYFGEEEPVGGG